MLYNRKVKKSIELFGRLKKKYYLCQRNKN